MDDLNISNINIISTDKKQNEISIPQQDYDSLSQDRYLFADKFEDNKNLRIKGILAKKNNSLTLNEILSAKNKEALSKAFAKKLYYNKSYGKKVAERLENEQYRHKAIDYNAPEHLKNLANAKKRIENLSNSLFDKKNGWFTKLKKNSFINAKEKIKRLYNLFKVYEDDMDLCAFESVKNADNNMGFGSFVRDFYGIIRLVEWKAGADNSVAENEDSKGNIVLIDNSTDEPFNLDNNNISIDSIIKSESDEDNGINDEIEKKYEKDIEIAARNLGLIDENEQEYTFNESDFKEARKDLYSEDDRIVSHQEELQDKIRVEDATLTDKQVAGILECDKWITRHMNEGRMTEGMVSRVLSLPMRERMFIYWTLEHGKRHNLNVLDAISSQQGKEPYVPSLNAFRKVMVANRLRLIKRLKKEHIYWGKIEDCLELLDENRESILLGARVNKSNKNDVENIFKPDESKNKKVKTDNSSEDESDKDSKEININIDTNKNRTSLVSNRDSNASIMANYVFEEDEDKDGIVAARYNMLNKKNAATFKAKQSKQKECMLDYIMALVNLYEKETLEKNSQNIDKLDKSKESYREAINATYHQLVEADKEMEEFYNSLSDKEKKSISKFYNNLADAGTVIKYSSQLLSMISSNENIVSSTASMAINLSGNNEDSLRDLTLNNIVFNSISGLTAVVSACINIMSAKFSNQGTAGKVTTALDIVRSVSSVASSTALVVKDVADITKSTDLLNNIGSIPSYISIAGNVVGMVSDSIKVDSTRKGAKKLKSASTSIKNYKNKQKESNSHTSKYEDKLLELTKQINSEKHKNSVSSLVGDIFGISSGSLSLGAGFAAGALATALTGAGIGFAVAGAAVFFGTMIKGHYDRKKRREETVADYLNIEKIVKKMLKSKYTRKNPTADNNDIEREVNTQYQSMKESGKLSEMIPELLGQIGYGSRKRFYKHIAIKYSWFIFDKVFSYDNKAIIKIGKDYYIKTGSKDMSNYDPIPAEYVEGVIKPYKELLEGMGCKVVFPGTNGEERMPSISTIVSKFA